VKSPVMYLSSRGSDGKYAYSDLLMGWNYRNSASGLSGGCCGTTLAETESVRGIESQQAIFVSVSVDGGSEELRWPRLYLNAEVISADMCSQDRREIAELETVLRTRLGIDASR
jgi:hypothetical protein